jgi:hypothetical protein
MIEVSKRQVWLPSASTANLCSRSVYHSIGDVSNMSAEEYLSWVR